MGQFQLMPKGGIFDGVKKDLYGPALGQGGNQEPTTGETLDFSHGWAEDGIHLAEGSLWGVPAQVSAGSADVAGAPVSGVISVLNSVSSMDQHSVIMKNYGSLWAYG